MNPKKITTQWFFSNPWPLCKYLGIYIKGDGLVLLPFLMVLGFLFLVSVRFGLIVLGIYIAVRGLGEMVYWLLQQFGPKTYRPGDYGLKHLNNEGIYIIYQLTSMLHIIIGISLIFFVFLFF